MEMHFVNGWTIIGGRGLWEIDGTDHAYRRLAEARKWCNGNMPKQPTSGMDVVMALSGSAGPMGGPGAGPSRGSQP